MYYLAFVGSWSCPEGFDIEIYRIEEVNEEMVKVSDVYESGGRFLSAELCEELKLWNRYLTIEEVEVREINEQNKIVAHFKEIDELLVFNKTNAKIMVEEFGDETDDWVGKCLMLQKVKRNYQGKLVDAIQVVPVKCKKQSKLKN